MNGRSDVSFGERLQVQDAIVKDHRPHNEAPKVTTPPALITLAAILMLTSKRQKWLGFSGGGSQRSALLRLDEPNLLEPASRSAHYV